MADKKKKIAKRRIKAGERKKKKSALRLVKSRPKPAPRIIERPGMPHMGAPEGFRSISMSQAMMEYAKPLMEQLEDKEDFNTAFQAAMVFWNYALVVERGERDDKLEQKIHKTVKSAFSLDKDAADALIEKMVERYSYLFPHDVQPDPGLPFMFIRKEVRHLIRPFDYEKLVLSDKVIPPDQDDTEIINKLIKLDRYIYEDTDYETYEDLLVSLKDEFEDRFEKWLMAKGVREGIEDFSSCLHIYFDFIYGYMHDEAVVFKSVPDEYFIEFFEDFLIRKLMTDPGKYVYWPPALKLFYQFLYEKGYLDNPETTIRQIDNLESYFIEVLKKQFS